LQLEVISCKKYWERLQNSLNLKKKIYSLWFIRSNLQRKLRLDIILLSLWFADKYLSYNLKTL